ncbi:MAG: A/G-specific adenine glycosylase [Planctomycetes bacterium]|nr:A/G-specific adenine glycosylase [Planctomycetota bacterium]
MKITRARQIEQVQQGLLEWYRRHSRDLPWRRRSDPYAIWVSEIMLQQTRVDQATPYYERFLKRFARIEDLAKASLDEVMKAWEGMGYYSRARNLHRTAQIVCEEYGGHIPDEVHALKKLPGIGPYTAGAIASIAFNSDEPVLDGNVTRVLCRVFAVGADPAVTTTQKKLWNLARKIVPSRRAGLFNQALMDLGATICLPSRPKCETCPIQTVCLAGLRGTQQRYPQKRVRKPAPHVTIVAGIIWKKDKILIGRRKPEGLLGGLWEFPGGKLEKGESLEEALHREIKEEVGIFVRMDRPLAIIKHAYTHFRITLHAFECTHLRGRARALGCTQVRWIGVKDLDRYAFPKANQKIMAALKTKGGQTGH